MKSSGIGGQAVLEGIMMRNGDRDAVAVRDENKEIQLKVEEHHPWSEDRAWARLPFIRGVFNFVDSMVVGVRTLMLSAEMAGEGAEEEEEDALSKFLYSHFSKETADNIFTGITVAFAIGLTVLIFILLPMFISSAFEKVITSELVLAVLEGVMRIALFLAYMLLISRMKEIQRTFMYHGAEHKCINCIEHGLELNVENVRVSSRFHKRCGTSFLLIVMILTVIAFMIIRVKGVVAKLVVRLLLIPVIAGISYEFLRLAGNSDNPVVNLLSKPGLLMQRITTKEPEDDMIEVAIAAVEAVFDWKKYLAENFGENSAE